VEARGTDKEARAHAMLAHLRETGEGGIVLRTLGRQYTGEERPRWSLGLYNLRDGPWAWPGPPDPLLGGTPCDASVVQTFWQGLGQRLRSRGWPAVCFRIEGELDMRIAFRRDNHPPEADTTLDPRLTRPSIHVGKIPLEGLTDPLAQEGTYLVAIGCPSQPLDPEPATSPRGVPRLEMPAFPDVDSFRLFLEEIGHAAAQVPLTGLVLAGFPPPVDASVTWTTLTPDPAVIEVNMAPASDVATFLTWARKIFAAAEAHALSPLRLHYNGEVADSGGGGQITLGGPTPEKSPFFVSPQLAPRLVCYFNWHPSLSYFFAPRSVGSSSQSPRPDERTRESFEELQVALELIARVQRPNPETIWGSLAPFLADPSGNTHRTEINVEKLWNPHLPDRCYRGLVEFRAFRMAPSAEDMAALAALLRAIAAMLTKRILPLELVDWGKELHDRFALPFFLRRDLSTILSELSDAGFGLDPLIVERLLNDERQHIGTVEFQDCRFTIKQAVEFWPLVGNDAMRQDRDSSRLVDASTTRIEVSLRPRSESRKGLEGWCLMADGYRVPMLLEEDGEGPLLIFGLRYRSFVPWQGLHPTLGAHGPLDLTLLRRNSPDVLRVTLYEWKPEGGPYEGLPEDLGESRLRRQERFVVLPLSGEFEVNVQEPPERAVSGCCLDLRVL
jgi:uncharacterized protein (DUF2126 family)